jgi:hypothetical protein
VCLTLCDLEIYCEAAKAQFGLQHYKEKNCVKVIIIIIPVLVGMTGTISNAFRKFLSSILGRLGIKEVQKTA